MNDVLVGDEKLIATAEASKISKYSKDYIGQLCREEKIECRRMSGQWYVSEGSLREYQRQGVQPVASVHAHDTSEKHDDADTTATPETENKRPAFGIKTGNVRDDTFTFDGVEYVATARAADLTGYTQDYVGQLARDEEIAARKVGRRWFVARKELIEHKKHNDALLHEVQAQSAGLRSKEVAAPEADAKTYDEDTVDVHINTSTRPEKDINFNVRYISETDMPLVPRIGAQEDLPRTYTSDDIFEEPRIERPAPQPVRTTHMPSTRLTQMPDIKPPVREQAIDTPVAPSAWVPTPVPRMRKRRSLTVRLVIPVLALSGVGVAAYSYVMGTPEVMLTLWETFRASGITEQVAQLIPGNEVTYTR